MERMKKSFRFYCLTFMLCLLIAFAVKSETKAADSVVNYISSGGRQVQITVPYTYGYRNEVELYNRKKKKIAVTTCDQYATFTKKTKKNTVYYYRFRKIDLAGRPVTGWTKAVPFTTIKGNKYSLKIKSKSKRTVSVRVPKVKGVKNYVIYIGSYSNAGFRKSKVAKPGQRVTLKSYAGHKFTYGWTYFVRVVPRIGKKKAQGLVGTGSFRFIKIYTYRYHYVYYY